MHFTHCSVATGRLKSSRLRDTLHDASPFFHSSCHSEYHHHASSSMEEAVLFTVQRLSMYSQWVSSFRSTCSQGHLGAASCSKHFLSHLSPSQAVGGLGLQSSGLRITPESFRVVQLEMLSFIHSHLHQDAWYPFPEGGGGSRSRRQCVCFIVLYLRKLSHLKMGEHLCPIFPGMYN